MTTIVKRIAKGSTLTVSELDANVTNLNNTKLETTGGTLTGLPVLANQDVDIISPVYPTTKPSLNLDFTRGQLDPRITFVRNSTAAYYDGRTTAMAEQNLCTGSQAIGGAEWGNQNSTAVTNTSSVPDGTTTASLLYPNAGVTFARSYSITGVTTTSNRYAYSVYAKASGISFIAFSAPSSGGSGACWFNLSTGTLGTDTTSSASITSIGNGWYRCSFTYIFNTGRLSIIVCDADNSVAVTPNGTNGVYLWGAQLEQRSSVTAYTPTTTSAITNYIPVLLSAPAGVARFDCDPITGKSLGLLIEESRTNLLTYSSDFRNTADAGTTRPWSYSAITLIPDIMIAPDGTLSMDAMVSSAAGVTTHFISQSPVFTGIGTVTVYAKVGATGWFYVTSLGRSPTDGGSQGIAWFNLSTGAKGSITPGFTSDMVAVGNGVYRCTLVCTTSASANREARYGSSSADGLQTIDAPVGTILAFIWGAQLEAGSFATSYTATLASTVTRAADAASMTGTNFSSWYNQAQGTVYAEADTVSSVTLTPCILSISDAVGATTNKLNLDFGSSGRFFNYTNSVNNFVLSPLTSGLTINTPFKFATSFQPNLVYAVGTGGSVKTSTAMTQMPQNIVQLRLSDNTSLNGHIRKLSYYPVALSSSNLVALTS